MPKIGSLSPDTFVQGGLISNVDVVVEKARYEQFNYGGKSNVTVTALRWTLRVLSSGETHDQYYSLGGSIDDYAPTEDGDQYYILKEGDGLVKGSNAAVLMTALVSCGFPKEKLADGRASTHVGTELHMVRLAPEGRGDMRDNQPAKEGERKADGKVLLPTELIKLPWETQRRKQVKEAPQRSLPTAGPGSVPGAVPAGPGVPPPPTAAPVAGVVPGAAPQAVPVSSGAALSAEDEAGIVTAVWGVLNAETGPLAHEVLAQRVFVALIQQWKDGQKAQAARVKLIDAGWMGANAGVVVEAGMVRKP